MEYRYSSQTKEERLRAFLNKNKKHVAVSAVIAVFLVASFYVSNSVITAYATYNTDLEQQLEDIEEALVDARAQKDSCRISLENANADIERCGSNLTSTGQLLEACRSEIDKFSNALQNLSSAFTACEAEKESALQSLKQLVRNTVKAICCSYGDVQSGVVGNWGIVGDSITCSGNYTVNCSSGETNY